MILSVGTRCSFMPIVEMISPLLIKCLYFVNFLLIEALRDIIALEELLKI